MQPIYLEMNAFGPYAGRQVIDFQQLGDRKFFLIYGPTGAGKTTILDAMCYALYGDTSGNVRSGTDMRSEYAAPDQTTYVHFDFAIGTKRYRIERQPEQQIAKKRGTGMKKKTASAALYELNEDGTVQSVLSTKYVNGEIERLLGFKSEQFRQVVLLPQGDFRKLLLASSSERQKIMQVLFRTEIYSRFQELVKERYDDIEKDYGRLQEHIVQALQMAGADDEAELSGQKTAAEEQLRKMGQAKQEALKDREAYQHIVQEAQALSSHWQALHTSRKEMTELERRAAETDLRRKEAEQLRKARLLAEPCAHLEEILAQGTEKGKLEQQAQGQVQTAQETLRKADAVCRELEGRESLYKADTGQLLQLQGLVGRVRSLTALHDRYETEKRRSVQLDQDLLALAKRKETYKRNIEKAGSPQDQLQELFAQAEQAKAGEGLLQERLRQERVLHELAGYIAKNKTARAAGRLSYEAAVQQARHDKIDFDAVQAAYVQGQSALLAQRLDTGMPCPVCGSLEHPHLAEIPADLPQKEDVQVRRIQAEQSEKKRQEQQVILEKLEAALGEQERQEEELRRAYPRAGTLKDWQARLEKESLRYADLTKKIGQCQKLSKQARDWQEKINQIDVQEQSLRKEGDEAARRFAAAAAARDQAEQDIPPMYRQEKDLQQAIGDTEKKLRQYEEAVREGRTAQTRAQQEAMRWQEQQKALQVQVADLREQYQKSYEQLKERVLQGGFTSVQECRQLQTQVGALEHIEQEIAAYDKAVHQAAGRLIQEEKAVGSQAEPDMAEYARRLKEKNDHCSQLAEAAAALKAKCDAVSVSLSHIAGWRGEQTGLSGQYKTVGAVYELVSGKNTGINFERYVLGALLDEVLNAANQRLLKMSRSRYQMQRSHDWADKRVRQIGLDIEIFDSYTGYARPANTLSGGETFLASLSLSLGLADVVQAYTGGIHLDTIFVDEGFGTLDAETLDYALKALLDLRQGGRLVGVISHVPELRERIDTRLAIHKTDKGSTAAFEIL